MGTVELVARGEDRFERLYARKRLHPHLRADTEFRTMFMDEARVAGLVRHPNVVSVLDLGEDSEGPFLILDFVDGLSAGQLLKICGTEGRLVPLQVAIRIARDAARGLAAAHELVDHDGRPLQLVHRDVSAQNILVGYDGVARVADFGIAKALGNVSHTNTGIIKGSLGYMSPEQLRYHPVDARSDLFALGVVLFELLAGRRLYGDKDGSMAARRILEEPPPDLEESRQDVPQALVELMFEMLAKSPKDRPHDAGAVAARLENILGNLVADEGVVEVGEFLDANLGHLRRAERETREESLRVLHNEVRKNRRGPKRLAMGAAIMSLVVAVAMLLWRGGGGNFSAVAGPTLMATGGWHTCAVREGKLYCWGKNSDGQLGLGHRVDYATPVRVKLDDVVAADGGDGHSCACLSNGTGYCFGDNRKGQLGDGTTQASAKPVQIKGIGDCRNVAAGASQSCVLRATGEVLCWGDNRVGQLGDGTRDQRSSPTRVHLPALAVQISLFSKHACARLVSGQVACWGEDVNGEFSAGDVLSPVIMPGVGDAKDLGVGGKFACVLRTAGEIHCWGTSAGSQTFAAPDAVSISIGLDHGCFLRRNSKVACWGNNRWGQLGYAYSGRMTDNPPRDVADLPPASAIAVGEVHSCARHESGLSCWGLNVTGQLGDASKTNRDHPVSVTDFVR